MYAPKDNSSCDENAMPDDQERPSSYASFFTREAMLFALVSGILGSIVFGVLLEPITDITRAALLHLAGAAGTALLDSTYRLAVKGPEAEALQVLVNLVLWAAFGGLAYLSLSARTLEQRARKLKRSLENGPLEEEVDPEKLRSDIIAVNKRARFAVFITTAMAIFVGIGVYVEQFRVNAALDIRSNFDLNLMSMSTYATTSERAGLVSEWSHLKTRHDFQTLSSHMSSVAAAHKQKLVLQDLS
jgi:hypothetical protein